MGEKCNALLKIVAHTMLDWGVIFLIGIRISFLLFVDTYLNKIDDGFEISMTRLIYSLGMIALDFCMMYGILNSKSGLVAYCLTFNHLINIIAYLLPCPRIDIQDPGLRFSSSMAVLISGTQVFPIRLNGFWPFMLEMIRLNLLASAHIALDIMNSPSLTYLPLWKKQTNIQVDEKNEGSEVKTIPAAGDSNPPLYVQVA